MTAPLNRRHAGFAAACSFVLVFASGAVQAQNFGPPRDTQIWTTLPQQVWMNNFGECWHSAYGPPPPPGVCGPAPRMVQVAAPPPRPAPAPSVAPPPRVEPAPAVVAPEPPPRKRDRN
jgi:hypothetical protein